MSTHSGDISEADFETIFQEVLSENAINAMRRQFRRSPAGVPPQLADHRLIMGLVFHALLPCGLLSAHVRQLTGHRIGAKFPRHAKAIAALEMLPRDVYLHLFKFAFVRNPWDLQVSSYHHIRRERPDLVADVPDFASFLRWKFDPDRPPQYHADMSTVVQSDYLIDLHGNLIVDYIGRYEFLVEDFETACRKIGIRAPKLPHRRRANGRDEHRTCSGSTSSATWRRRRSVQTGTGKVRAWRAE